MLGCDIWITVRTGISPPATVLIATYRCRETPQMEVQTTTMAHPNPALGDRTSRPTPGKTTIPSTRLVLRLHRKPRDTYVLHGHATYTLLVWLYSSGTRVSCEFCLSTMHNLTWL